jgi:hypothetical protein
MNDIAIFKENINVKTNHLFDYAANTKGYEGSQSIVGYANSTNIQWKAEADAFVAWRDQVWEHVYIEYMAIDAGGDIPDEDAFMATLPQIVWP